MVYLILCIASSSLILLLFKHMEKRNIDSFQAIVINYLAAVLLGLITSGRDAPGIIPAETGSLLLGLVVGIIFIVVFFLIALSTKHAGVSVTTVATKMSVVIPVVFSIFRYNEILDWSKITGIIIALIALFLTTYNYEKNAVNYKAIIFPLTIFLGTGIVDSLIKYSQAEHIPVDQVAVFNTMVFGTSFLIGLFVSMLSLRKQIKKFKPAVLAYGTILGLANFGSLYFLISALNHSGIQSSVLFPLNNIGVVILSVSLAVIIFNEKLSRMRLAGIIVSLLAIILLIGI